MEAAERRDLGESGDGDGPVGGAGGDVGVDEVLACAFDSWYDTFKSVTLRSRVIPLSEDVVRYLQSDGIFVPAGGAAAGEDSDSDWGDGGSDSEGGSRGGGGGGEPSFPELEAAIRASIEELGGAVLPKLNWSAPKDARWIYGTLRCDTVQEVFTLLKASDFVAHDLCHSFDHCANGGGGRSRPDRFSLVLRTWYAIDESHEFRCFVHGGRLRAVSQRHHSVFFPHLVEGNFAEAVKESIAGFFEAHVRDSFQQHRYAFDVLVGKAPRLKVRLIDFSPWSPSTDPLLFDWDELRALAAASAQDVAAPPELRIVRNETERRAKLENYHSLPVDVAQLGRYTNEEMEELCRKAEESRARGEQDRGAPN